MADRWDDLSDDELRARLFHRLVERGDSRPGLRAAELVRCRDEEHGARWIDEVLAS